MVRARSIFGVDYAVVVTLDAPAMAGPRIPIETADGCESWGPAPPPRNPSPPAPPAA